MAVRTSVVDNKLPALMGLMLEQAQIACDTAAEAAAEEMRREIYEGPKTGKKYRDLPNVSSAPGEHPADQLGALYDSIGTERHGEAGVIGRDVVAGTHYGPLLEEGTPEMEPRPFFAPALPVGGAAGAIVVRGIPAKLAGRSGSSASFRPSGMSKGQESTFDLDVAGFVGMPRES